MHASTSLRRAVALPVTLLLAGGAVVAAPHTADASSAPSSTRTSTPPKIKKAMKVAKRQIGDPYVYGATGPGSFDCSGFTSFAFRKAGIKLPRTSDAQARHARSISRKKLRRGDLVFFHSGGNVYHVGIYWGRNNGHRIILDAPRPGQRVGFTRVWTNSWFPGRVGPKRTVKKIHSVTKRQGKAAAPKPKSISSATS
ncbi:C40 family peptidase [Nocardioidaceae bacterium SCSIO 66511]|nr:C40 family peptidase [Nocardioidaceae bacterium SCSIO 66511]